MRPQRLLDRPEAIDVIYATPEGVPRRFVWRRAVHDIARVEGPERIAPEWWRQPSSARLRDYYRVEDAAGRRYWIYREGLIGDGRGGLPELVHPRAVRLMPEKSGLFARMKLVRTGDMPPPPIDARRFVELGVTSPFSFLRGASDAIELVLTRARAGHGRDRHRRPQHAGRRRADAQRLQGRGAEAADRLPARSDRRAEPARLPDRPRRLWPAVAAAQPGQDARREGRVRAGAGRRRRRMPEGIAFIAWPRGRSRRFRSASCRGCAKPCRHCAMSRRRWLYRGDDIARIERLDRIARAQRLHDPRHQRRPLSRARPPAAAGRDDLHPRESDDRRPPAICSTPMPSGI